VLRRWHRRIDVKVLLLAIELEPLGGHADRQHHILELLLRPRQRGEAEVLEAEPGEHAPHLVHHRIRRRCPAEGLDQVEGVASLGLGHREPAGQGTRGAATVVSVYPAARSIIPQ
jgi:hypothetical protein